jgi:4-amino-4-deoxy-L-arabinose transferase-like glycosyltransferase
MYNPAILRLQRWRLVVREEKMALVANAPAAAVSPHPSNAEDQRRSILLSAIASALVVAASSLGIISTYGQLSQTWDEPTHIAAGLEWLEDGTYQLQTENPPFGRIGAAVGVYVAGGRLPPREKRAIGPVLVGKQVLYDGDHVRVRLAAARAGVLPLFWLSGLVVWFWFRRSDPLGAFIAVAALATLPPFLAHAGQATTDVPFVGVFMMVLVAFRSWLDRPDYLRSGALGAILGLALATKFTTIPFFAATIGGLGSAALLTTAHRGRFCAIRLRRATFVVIPIMLLAVWSAYGFSVGTLSEYRAFGGAQGERIIHGPDAKGLMGWLSRLLGARTVPAPGFLHGLMTLSAHNYAGHEAYALGEVSQSGFWYSYPLGLAVKSPLPFLLLFGSALIVLVSRRRAVPWWVSGLLATTFLGLAVMSSSRVNIGTRHVVLLYAMMAIVSGHGLSLLWREHQSKGKRALGGIITVLLCWQVVDLWRYHPDWLAYFNPLAGDDPGYVLNDSDLDWGQGVYRLEAFFVDKNVESLTIHYNGSARLCAYHLPPLEPLNPTERPKGWVAISDRLFRAALSRYEAGELITANLPTSFCDDGPLRRSTLDRAAHSWLATATPVDYAGRSIRIYHLE